MSHRSSPFRRVFFVGAGFSAGMRYPVGQHLMSRLVQYLEGSSGLVGKRGRFRNSLHGPRGEPERAAQILEVIERVLKTYFATKLTAIQRVDVAEFFTLAHTLSERSWLLGNTVVGSRRRRDPLAPSETTLFADLAAVTRSYFRDLSLAFEYPKDIDEVLRLVDPESDAIINFNWDEEVDIWLSSGRDEDVSYTLGAWREERYTLVLKPHGSVGWYDLQRGIGNAGSYLIAMSDERIPRYDKRVVAYVANELPIDIETDDPHSPLACPPVITAPTFAKRFDYVEQQQIWQDVLEVCRNANVFVFLGYSLPKDDFLTRAAIRAAISENDSRKRMRCLVVDRSFEESKLLNFLSVFEGLTADRNHLPWEFGNNDRSLADAVLEKLRRAYVRG